MRKRLAVLSSITVLTSCLRYYRMGADEQLAAASTITVTFASPRDLEATRDTVVYRLSAVEKVYGKVERAGGGHPHFARPAARIGPASLPREARLTILPDASTNVAVRRVSGAITALMLAALAVVVAISIGLGTAE